MLISMTVVQHLCNNSIMLRFLVHTTIQLISLTYVQLTGALSSTVQRKSAFLLAAVGPVACHCTLTAPLAPTVSPSLMRWAEQSPAVSIEHNWGRCEPHETTLYRIPMHSPDLNVEVSLADCPEVPTVVTSMVKTPRRLGFMFLNSAKPSVPIYRMMIGRTEELADWNGTSESYITLPKSNHYCTAAIEPYITHSQSRLPWLEPVIAHSAEAKGMLAAKARVTSLPTTRGVSLRKLSINGTI